MKFILEVEDPKVPFLLDLLQHFEFVKTEPLTADKALLLEEVKEAVGYINMIKKGKYSPKPLNELL